MGTRAFPGQGGGSDLKLTVVGSSSDPYEIHVAYAAFEYVSQVSFFSFVIE